MFAFERCAFKWWRIGGGDRGECGLKLESCACFKAVCEFEDVLDIENPNRRLVASNSNLKPKPSPKPTQKQPQPQHQHQTYTKSQTRVWHSQ